MLTNPDKIGGVESDRPFLFHLKWLVTGSFSFNRSKSDSSPIFAIFAVISIPHHAKRREFPPQIEGEIFRNGGCHHPTLRDHLQRPVLALADTQ